SAMFFGLFGSYFSLTGEGRFLYGAIGSLVIIPIYILLSIRLQSRLFVWFSYIMISVFAGFLLPKFYLLMDQFYFGIMLFNGVFILAYHYLKDKDGLQRFTNEFIPYIQANLVLSTILMLVFFDNEVMYSFNLFLTAGIYFAMIF